MLESLLIILVPMLIGYAFKIKNIKILQQFGKITMLLLYMILFIMGVSLGQLDNLAQQLPQIGVYALTFIVFIQGLTFLGLFIYDKLSPQPLAKTTEKMPSRWRIVLDSLKLCLVVIVGFFIGLWGKGWVNLPFGSSTYVLVVLIFCVGIQLRNNGISICSVFFNQRGMITGAIFVLMSLLGGIIGAQVLNVPIVQGLAVSSGLGWYSLSSVTLNNAWGPIWGSIAFFNDLSRELMSLFIVPLFMQHYRSTAIGYTGATAIDCTLPIIQKAGGVEVLPLAFSFGFITNIAPPILLVFFTSVPL
ncbi:lysine exporter LysO family protein [uncultured Aggregatibacter sp.]|uniref:lysine exporter LysO family protein n=1 Tax=uncultured Aggregatibacter sp. TaxID=470564 RepID=UPI0025FCD459|nr:lysine exporter LysO family protein [uncultured Aggregatibacter sp.]